MISSAAERVHGPSLSFIQWRIQRRGPGGSRVTHYLDQTETRRAEKNFLETCTPLYLRVWMTQPPPPPPYLKVWIRHCYLPPKLLQYVTYAVTLRRHGSAEAGERKLEHILLLKVH